MSRDRRIQQATKSPCDVLVIGGGIHGASAARLAAMAGLRVVLLERDDYAAATSSRSSKMAHGGLRYLEMGDFKQVFEGIKARDSLFNSLPHLVKPSSFLIPLSKGKVFTRGKMGIGLSIYDLFLKERSRRSRWRPQRTLDGVALESFRKNIAGAYEYTDGILRDSRLVIENIVGADRAGAACINYAEVNGLARSGKGVDVTWTDRISGARHETSCGVVINCAGPWVGKFLGAGESPELRYSRGSHLLFSTPWRDPSLFLPLPEKGRYYFVWPHPTGTMVGTTEREVDSLESDPLPSADELDEMFMRLEKDIPSAGLNRASAHYCFAGVRSLPATKGGSKGVSRLSRRHIWHEDDRILSLYGGKLTTANWTAAEAVEKATTLLGREHSLPSESIFLFPGSLTHARYEELTNILVSDYRLDAVQAQEALARFGARIERMIHDSEMMKPLDGRVLRGEVVLAAEEEHLESAEDLFRRRLELEFWPDHGLPLWDSIAETISSVSSIPLSQAELEKYRARLNRTRTLLHRELC